MFILQVKAEISMILYKAQIKYLKEEGAWPSEFSDSPATTAGDKAVERTADKLTNVKLSDSEGQEDADDEQDEEEEDSDSSDGEIFKNTNR
jgi:hypothetical protein